MRILGIDHGSKRIGVAWSDQLLLTAQPGTVINGSDPEAALRELRELCDELEVGVIVVGLPRNMDGSEGGQASLARDFMKKVEAATGRRVEAWDERLTSVAADEILDQRGVTGRSSKGRAQRKFERDAIAAAVLLTSFLEARRDDLREELGIQL